MLDTLISLVAPHVCLQCSTEGALWCNTCKLLSPTAIERCYRCHRLSPAGRTCLSCRSSSSLYGVRAATRYEGYAKQLIWRLKFERARAGAQDAAELMDQRFALPDDAVVTHIPTSTGRVRQRGYDQALLLARSVAKHSGLTHRRLLVRLGQQQQRTATRRQRLLQLDCAFVVPHPELVEAKNLVLVDDVITTGATLNAAAKALKSAGAKRVSAVVFAQA